MAPGIVVQSIDKLTLTNNDNKKKVIAGCFILLIIIVIKNGQDLIENANPMKKNYCLEMIIFF